MIKSIAFDMMGVIFEEAHIITNKLFPMLPEPKDYSLIKSEYKKYMVGINNHYTFWRNIKQSSKIEHKFLNSLKLDKDLLKITRYLKPKYALGIISEHSIYWSNYLIKKYDLDKIFYPIIIS